MGTKPNEAMNQADAGMAYKIIYWEDPKSTGVAVLTLNLLYYLFTFGGYSVPQLMVLTAWISLISRFVFVVGVHAMSIFSPQYKKVPDQLADCMANSPLSEEDFKPVADMLLSAVNTAKSFWGGVSSCKDKMFTLKVLAVLHVASYVANFFSLCGLSYLAIMGLLTIPRAIRDHQSMIQETTTQLWTQVSEKLTVVLEAVPKASQLKGDAGKKDLKMLLRQASGDRLHVRRTKCPIVL